MDPVRCSTLAHLEWTLNLDWHQFDGGKSQQAGWLSRATSWREGRAGTEAWTKAIAGPLDLSWSGLCEAHRKAGLDPCFRTTAAACRGRYYGWRPGLEARFARKLNQDAVDDVSPVARAIRGFLDICHVHPFVNGNARAACTWMTWCLVDAGLDVPDMEEIMRLPIPPTHDRVPHLMARILSSRQQ